MGRISINNIKPLEYEGYLWLSDSEKPIIYDHKKLELPQASNPFVVEGKKNKKKEGVSYSIKYVDGQYIVIEHIVADTDINNPHNEIKTYLANRMGDRWLKFLRYWEKKEDENCLNMSVLSLTKTVFIGFKD